jgi:hypothetical protein
MGRLNQLFDQFLQERTYLKNVTPKTRVWYESAWKAFTSTRAERPSSTLIEHSD